jgi:hypothetical protein
MNFLLNHSSKAGTKWFHCRIRRTFGAALRAGRAAIAAAEPAAAKKSRLVVLIVMATFQVYFKKAL